MADKELILKEKVEGSGIFDFSKVYTFVYNWLREQEGYGVIEEKYAEKIAGNARDIEIEWKCTKNYNDYFKGEIAMRWNISGLTDVEVEIDKAKTKTNKGKISIELKGTLIGDPESKWDASPFNKFLKGIYTKYVFAKSVDTSKAKISEDVVTLKDEIKAFLDLSGKR